jgi:hypothetical protein
MTKTPIRPSRRRQPVPAEKIIRHKLDRRRKMKLRRIIQAEIDRPLPPLSF